MPAPHYMYSIKQISLFLLYQAINGFCGIDPPTDQDVLGDTIQVGNLLDLKEMH